MIEFLLSLFDFGMNVITLGFWSKSQGDCLVCDHYIDE